MIDVIDLNDQATQVCILGAVAMIMQRANNRMDNSYKELTGNEFTHQEDKVIAESKNMLSSLEVLKEANKTLIDAKLRMEASLDMI